MASKAYYEWVDAGKPYARSRPAREFRDVVRGHGFTVYDYPDDDHLLKATPEDHTPFSATGWPIASKRWFGHADDVMDDGPVPLPVLARRIIADVDARVPGTEWVKYINWTDEQGICRHESWANSEHKRTTTSSADKGHIHVSARSDMDTSDVVSRSGWDPVARALEHDMTSPWDESTKPYNGVDKKFGTEMVLVIARVNYLANSFAGAITAAVAKLQATIDAAQDPADDTVVLSEAQLAALREGILMPLQATIEALPIPTPDDVADELRDRLAG